MVEVALHENDAVAAADRLARHGEPVEETLLREERRLRRVQVLRLALGRERAAAEADGTAALVAHDEEEPVAEPVVRALALGARLQQPGLDEQVLGMRAAERPARSSPRRRARGRARTPSRSPRERCGPRGTSRPRCRACQPLGVEALRVGDRREEPLAPVLARTAPLAPRDRDAEPAGERLDGLGEVEPVDLPDEVDDVAARAAAEAVVQALVAVDGEGRRPLVVERAEPLPGAPGLLQARVIADDLDDVGGRAKLGEDAVVDVEVVHGGVVRRKT